MYGHADYIERLLAHPGFDNPAIAQHTVRTAEIDKWFESFNENKENRDRIRPGGFISAWSPAPGPKDALWELHRELRPERAYKAGSPLTTYEDKLRKRGSSQSQIDDAIDRDDEEWSPIGPFSQDSEWIVKNSFDRKTGLPVPPWVQPQTYRHILWNFHTFPERKFVNGSERGLMVVPHIVVATPANYVGKATNRLDEAEIPELSEAGEFVNEYVPQGRTVPAHRARALLTPLLAKPAKKAVAEDEREQRVQAGSVAGVTDNGLSKAELAILLDAISQMLAETSLARRTTSIDEWNRSAVNFMITDGGRLTLKEVAARLGISNTYLSDIVSSRWKASEKVPLRQMIDSFLAWPAPEEERRVLPPPAPDDDEQELRDNSAGGEIAEQLTDGSPQSYAVLEACKIMLFNSWERKALSENRVTELVEGTIDEKVLEKIAGSLHNQDWAGMIDSIEHVQPDDDDDIVSLDEIS